MMHFIEQFFWWCCEKGAPQDKSASGPI